MDKVPSIEEQQSEVAHRFEEARGTVSGLVPEMPALPESKKASVALLLGISPLPISAINTAVVFGWPDKPHIGLLCLLASCITATCAMIIGSNLGGRRAPLLAARLGYLFGLAWLSLIVLAVTLFLVADRVLYTLAR
jgi:hypothetical protein